jgi:hypothetical protein
VPKPSAPGNAGRADVAMTTIPYRIQMRRIPWANRNEFILIASMVSRMWSEREWRNVGIIYIKVCDKFNAFNLLFYQNKRYYSFEWVSGLSMNLL